VAVNVRRDLATLTLIPKQKLEVLLYIGDLPVNIVFMAQHFRFIYANEMGKEYKPKEGN
jgi:hypothetical protein